MSRNAKIALIVLGTLSIICLGICGAGYLLLPRLAENIVSQNPEDSKRIGASIADYTLPENYTEVMGMNFLVYKLVGIAPTSGAGNGMVFMLMGTSATGVSQAEMERQMQQSFQQQFGRSGSRMEVVGQERVTIRGQAVNLTIAENDSSPKLRQAIGTFNGKNGMVVVMVMGSPAQWDTQLIRDFLGSIQ